MEGIEDPLVNTLIVTVIYKPGEVLRVETNGAEAHDVIAVLHKAAVTATLDSVISDAGLDDEDDEDEDEDE